MVNPMDLSRKCIIITGASSGIGRETSILISKLGAKVIMFARREEKFKETFSYLGGEGSECYCFDSRNIGGIENIIR